MLGQGDPGFADLTELTIESRATRGAAAGLVGGQAGRLWLASVARFLSTAVRLVKSGSSNREKSRGRYERVEVRGLRQPQCASVVVAVHVLVPFVPQMFRPFVDMTLRATRGALRALVPAMFGAFVTLMRPPLGAFPTVVRIV